MKVVILIFFSFMLCLSTLKGQSKNSSEIYRVYDISIINYPQKINLIEYKNGDFSGLITIKYYAGRFTNNGFFKRIWKNTWNIKPNKAIIDSAEINSELVEKLMLKLQLEGIENIKDDADDKVFVFLDGKTVNFQITIDSLLKFHSFYEIYPLSSNKVEKTILRVQAQKLVTTIHDLLNLESQFKQSKERLQKGYYFYTDRYSFIEFYNNKPK